VSPLTNASISLELHQDCLVTLEQLATSITVLALHVTHRPEDTPRIRALCEQLLEAIHWAETDMAVFDLP